MVEKAVACAGCCGYYLRCRFDNHRISQPDCTSCDSDTDHYATDKIDKRIKGIEGYNKRPIGELPVF